MIQRQAERSVQQNQICRTQPLGQPLNHVERSPRMVRTGTFRSKSGVNHAMFYNEWQSVSPNFPYSNSFAQGPFAHRSCSYRVLCMYYRHTMAYHMSCVMPKILMMHSLKSFQISLKIFKMFYLYTHGIKVFLCTSSQDLMLLHTNKCNRCSYQFRTIIWSIS